MSDYNERACTKCGSLLHHEDDCSRQPSVIDQQPSKTPRTDAALCREEIDECFYFVHRDFARQLETELATANTEVERLRLIAADRNEWQEVATKVALQRDTLLANSKALAEDLRRVLERPLFNKALGAHNKLMEQLSPTAAGSGMGG